MNTKKELRERLDLLRSLRAELTALCVVKCRMSHERVVRDKATGLPEICRFPADTYRRIGLCTPERRAKQLGCSHTTARIKLDDAIHALAANCADDGLPSSTLNQEANWLDNAIHLLDHQKGEAEKKLAKLQEQAHRSGDMRNKEKYVRAAEEEVRRLEELHSDYVERIGRLRDRVVSEIDRQIGEPGGAGAEGDRNLEAIQQRHVQAGQRHTGELRGV